MHIDRIDGRGFAGIAELRPVNPVQRIVGSGFGGISVPSPVTTAPTGVVAEGCGGTQLRRGDFPAWTKGVAPPIFLRYALSDQENIAAFLFGDPLRAGRIPPDEPRNKILWIVRNSPEGQPQPLNVAIFKPGAEKPTDRWQFSGSKFYPSRVTAPTPGCWHFVLDWNGHRATLDLEFVALS